MAMARLAPEDKFACLAPRERLAKSIPDLDLEDPDEPAPETLVDAGPRRRSGAAMAVKGVTNSEGGGASFFPRRHGAGHQRRIFRPLCRHQPFHRRRGAGGRRHRHGARLRQRQRAPCRRSANAAEDIGKRAGERTVARLNPRKVEIAERCRWCSIRANPPACSGHFAGAISGAAIARGVSFLKDRMGEEIFAPGISIIDDPHRLRGLRSKPFDGEGVANRAAP